MMAFWILILFFCLACAIAMLGVYLCWVGGTESAQTGGVFLIIFGAIVACVLAGNILHVAKELDRDSRPTEIHP